MPFLVAEVACDISQIGIRLAGRRRCRASGRLQLCPLPLCLCLCPCLASFASFPSTFAVLAFASAVDAFAFAWGAKSGVFVLAILNTVCMCDVHVHAVLIGARHGGL